MLKKKDTRHLTLNEEQLGVFSEKINSGTTELHLSTKPFNINREYTAKLRYYALILAKILIKVYYVIMGYRIWSDISYVLSCYN